MVPSLGGEQTFEPIFVRDGLGRPLEWTGALPPALEERLDRALPRGAAGARAARPVGADRVRLLAALAIGTCCALVAAALLGTMPRAPVARARTRRFAARRDRADLWLQQAGAGMGLLPFWAGSAFAGLFAVLFVATLTGSVFVASVPGGAVALDSACVLRPAPARSAARGATRVARRAA